MINPIYTRSQFAFNNPNPNSVNITSNTICGNSIFTDGKSTLSRLPVEDNNIIPSTMARVTNPSAIRNILMLLFFKYAKIDTSPRKTAIFKLTI